MRVYNKNNATNRELSFSVACRTRIIKPIQKNMDEHNFYRGKILDIYIYNIIILWQRTYQDQTKDIK